MVVVVGGLSHNLGGAAGSRSSLGAALALVGLGAVGAAAVGAAALVGLAAAALLTTTWLAKVV